MNIKDLKEMKKRLAALSVAGTMVASGVGFATTEVNADEMETEGTKVEQESDYSYTSEVTTDKSEVENRLDEKENALKDNYEITAKEVIEIENQVISTEKVKVNESFDTEKAANKKKEEIEKGDIESSNLSVEKKDAIVVNVDETFDTEEKALEFLKEYKEKYNVDLTVSEIYSDWVSNGTIKVKELFGLSEEERDKEVEEITKEIESSNTDTIRYEVSITKTSKTEKVYVKDNVTNETKVFDSLEKANDFIDGLKLSENENIKIEINGPKLNKVLTSSETFEIEDVFNSEEELNVCIEKLESEGYVLSDITKKEVIVKETEKVPTGKVIVSDSTKLDSSSKYEVLGNYIMIKQASGNIAVWTKEEMTKEEQESFKESWFKGNYDPSIGKDVNVYFIFGEGEKGLSYIGNGWGTYNISAKDNKIIMTCDSKKISHLNYGNFEQEYIEKENDVTKYMVSGNKTMNNYKDEYLVDYKKTEKMFEDKVTYGAVINKETLTRDVEYNAKGSYEQEQEVWNLKGEYIKNNRGSLFYGLIKANDKELNNDQNIDENVNDNSDKQLNDNNPKTGDEKNLAIPLAMAGAALAGAGVTIGRSRKRTIE